MKRGRDNNVRQLLAAIIPCRARVNARSILAGGHILRWAGRVRGSPACRARRMRGRDMVERHVMGMSNNVARLDLQLGPALLADGVPRRSFACQGVDGNDVAGKV